MFILNEYCIVNLIFLQSNKYSDSGFLEHLKKTALYSATVITEYICRTQTSGDVYLKVNSTHIKCYVIVVFFGRLVMLFL